MVYKGKKIVNASTGQQLVFLTTAAESKGRMLEMEMSYKRKGPEPPMHFHPSQDETFQVLSGMLTVRLYDEIKTYRKGEIIRIPRNTPHAMWNSQDQPVQVNWIIQPALETENFFETVFTLGNPGLVERIALAHQFAPVFRLHQPPIVIIRALYVLLYPLIWLKKML